MNNEKSSIFFSRGCPQPLRESVKGALNVQNESLSDRYLGMPTVVDHSKNGTFKYLRDRVWEKIKGWMEKLLSAAGKEVLIKSVAQSIPVYSMACFRLPRGLCESVTSIIRQFWWGSIQGRRKPAWASWDVMTRPKHLGGLGFRDLEIFNLALLSRQAWRLLHHPESLSARILKAVCYSGCSLLEAELGSPPSQIWRAVLDGRDILSHGIIRRIGTGETTKIWTDNWLPRRDFMRPLTSMVAESPVLVSALVDASSSSWREDVVKTVFIPIDAEEILKIPLCTRRIDDFCAWSKDSRGVFLVRSAYRMILHTKLSRES